MQPKQPIRVCVNGIINVIDNTNTNTHTHTVQWPTCQQLHLGHSHGLPDHRWSSCHKPVDHDYAGLVQTGNHTHRTRQFILNKRLRSFNENNKGQLSDV